FVVSEIYAVEEKYPTTTTFTMKDDSMEPLIPINSVLQISEGTEYINGDIVVAKVVDERLEIRKIFNQNESIFLIPMNGKYEVEKLSFEDIVVLGKVTNLTIAL